MFEAGDVREISACLTHFADRLRVMEHIFEQLPTAN